MRRWAMLLGVIAAAALLVAANSLFTVDQTESALILQLGKPVRVERNPGLHTKRPFLQQVLRFDNRILEYDAAAKGVITKDKKNLVVDNYAKWRIRDPLLFYQTMRTEIGAQARLDDIIYSNLRAELGKFTLSQVVSESRAKIMETVTKDTNRMALSYGVEVVDVRIKRADLPPENEKHVYDRMKAEREQEAKRYRSEGEEAAIKIRAEADKERTILLAEAKRKAQEIRGQGDAAATRIYAEAYRQDPDFFEFLRTMEAYGKALDDRTTVVLTPESDFFRYLRRR